MAEPKPLSIDSKIPTHAPNLFAFILSPFVWLKNYLEDLKDELLQMIWSELFKGHTHPDQAAHLIAFTIFSIFCLIAHLGFEDYLVYLICILWPIDYLAAKMSQRNAAYRWMTLKQNSDQLKWQLRHPRTGRKETQTFRFSQVQRVIIRSEEYEHNAFSSVTVSSWEVYFEVEGHEQEFIVHHEIDVYQALRKAVRLARALRVPLKIADSYGVGTFAESPMPVINLQYSNWEESYTQDGVDIIKNIKTINRTKLTKAVLEQAGSFLFLAITIGVMERWGSFLVWLIGPRLGLVDSTTLYIDLSFWGIVGFFTPDFGLESLIIITAMLSAIIYSIWQNSLNQVIAVDSQSLTYQRGNKFQVDLTRNSLKHVLIIYADHPLLLLVSSKKMLVIDRVGDEEEIEELYSKLTKALKF